MERRLRSLDDTHEAPWDQSSSRLPAHQDLALRYNTAAFGIPAGSCARAGRTGLAGWRATTMSTSETPTISFCRPSIGEEEIAEVVDTLRRDLALHHRGPRPGGSSTPSRSIPVPRTLLR